MGGNVANGVAIMTQTVRHPEAENVSQSGQFTVSVGPKQFEEIANAQKVLVASLQDSQKQWLDSFRAKTQLASEYATKLMATHSVPEAIAVCQEWTIHRIEIVAEDGKHLAADAQKLMENGARLFPHGVVASNPHGDVAP